jgi:hypothetical protein
VRKEEAVEFVRSDWLLQQRGPEPDIYIDFLPDPVGGYLAELGGDSASEEPPEGLFYALIPSFADRRPLICLDSAGGTGWLEYQTVRRLMGQRCFAIWLDDINHVKHYRSLLDLQQDEAVSHLSLHWDDGWCVALVNANSRC